MSYIQYLPTELLSYILELACIAEAPAQTQTAAVLGEVSKLWRNTVFNIPSIWTSFHVYQDMSPRNFEAALSRSHGLLVDIHVVDEGTPLKAAREQLNALAAHSSRWKDVEVSHPDAFALLEKSIPLLLPTLQSLAVKTGSQRLSPIPMSFYEPFPEYPAPPDLSLEWKNRMYPSLRCLDFHNIELKPRETEHFLGFLEAHSTLEKLALWDIWELDAYIPSRTVVLPHLKELQLRGIPSSEILRWVSASSLQKLVVEISSQLRLWAAVNIASNYATTTNVTLIRFSNTPDALLNVLSAVPLASEVELISTDLQSRNSFRTESILIEHKLPSLTSLHIQGVTSLPLLKAVVEAYRETLTGVKIHCLDLGLPEDSFLEDYSERDEALAWMKNQTRFKFDIDHSSDTFGGRYRCYEDQIRRKKMVCGGNRCRTSL